MARANPGPFACGVCGKRCRSNSEAFACEQAHDREDPADLVPAPYISSAQIKAWLARVLKKERAA